MKNSKVGQYFLLIFIVFIFLSIIFLIYKYSNLQTQASIEMQRPLWLSRPIPNVDKIKSIINNSQFKSLQYHKAFFKPIKVDISQKGRPNPFVPFNSPKKKK